MKFALSLFISLFLGVSVAAQQPPPPQNTKIDSLNKVIATTPSDTVKGRSLCRLCRELVKTGAIEAGKEQATEGLKIVERKKDATGTALCLQGLGVTYHFLGDYPQARSLIQRGIQISTQIGDQAGIAGGLNNLGLLNSDEGNYDQAIKCLTQALKIREALKDKMETARALNNIGNVYHRKAEYAQAIQYFQLSLPIHEQIGNQEGMAQCYNNMGNVYYEQSNYPQALEFYHKSLIIKERLGNPLAVAKTVANIGLIYQAQKDYPQTLKYFERALKIFEQSGNQLFIAMLLGNIGSVYMNMQDFDKALAYQNKSLKISEELNNQAEISATLGSIGSILRHQHKFTEALTAFQRSLKIGEEIGSQLHVVRALGNIGDCYIHLGKAAVGKPYAMKGYALADTLGQLEQKRFSAQTVYKADSALGNWQAAFVWHQRYKAIVDSLNNDDKSRTIGRLEAQYEYDKAQEQQKIQQIQEAEQRKWVYYLIGAIFVIILLLTGFIYYRYRAKTKLNRVLHEINDELASKNEEILIQRDELSIRNEEICAQRDEISAQSDQIGDQRDQLNDAYNKLKELDEFKEAMFGMIVHDLKNPLNAIIGISNKNLLSTNDQVAIRQAGKQMLTLTLNILDVQKFEQAEVRLNRRDEALSAIVQDSFEQVSLLVSNKNQQLSITFAPNIGVNADFELISRVLTNLLTNAIKYTPNNGKITIGAEEIADNQVQISVSDTGQGIPVDKLDTVFDKFSQVEARKSGSARSTGLGLTLCKLVVEAHGGSIWVRSEVNIGTTFYFTLPKSLTPVQADHEIIVPVLAEPGEIAITEEDRTYVQPYLEALLQLEIYEAGDVLNILAQVPDSPALSVWKSEVEKTVFASNQERYEKLVKVFS